MMRFALAAIIVFAAMRPAAAEFYLEELRIPMAAAGSPGLEALLIRASGAQRYPLALISHGTSGDAQVRRDLSPFGFYWAAIELARRGFTALVVMRRGYGSSGGAYAEQRGCCRPHTYLHAAKAGADDLRAAIAAMKSRADVTTQGMIAIGVSTGGFATIALTSDAPAGLAAAINFAGGLHRASLTGTGIRNASDEAARQRLQNARQEIANTDVVGLCRERHVLQARFGAQAARRVYRQRRPRPADRCSGLRQRRPSSVFRGIVDLGEDGR